MGFFANLRTLAIATCTSKGGRTHAERLNSYYRHQAAAYDDFRQHLLHGRQPLLDRLPIEPGAKIVELGAGTGWNAAALGDRLPSCVSYRMVDLCEPLMAQARARSGRLGWRNVEVIRADAEEYVPPEPADIVILSYALTMMPRWFATIDNAVQMLRPGGCLGVTDFYVSAPQAEPPLVQHRWWQRILWRACFAWHHVYLKDDHLPYLQHRLETVHLEQAHGRMPFMAGLKAPYFVFVGRKSSYA